MKPLGSGYSCGFHNTIGTQYTSAEKRHSKVCYILYNFMRSVSNFKNSCSAIIIGLCLLLSFFKAPTLRQRFLLLQTQDAISIWMHGGVSHPRYLFEENPDLPSIFGEKSVSEISNHFGNQKQGCKSQEVIRKLQIWIKHTEDGIGFDIRAFFFRKENGGRHIRGHPVGLA